MPPADAEIAAEIAAVASLNDVPRPENGWETLGDEVLEAYLARTDAVLTPGSPRTARVVYTAMHGVGKDVLTAAFARAGFPPMRRWWPSRPTRTPRSRRWRSPTRRSRARWTSPSRRPAR